MKQPPNQSSNKYSKALWDQVLLCGQVYDESRLKVILTEGVAETLLHSMRNYCSTQKSASLLELARYSDTLRRLTEVSSQSSLSVQPYRNVSFKPKGKGNYVLQVGSTIIFSIIHPVRLLRDQRSRTHRKRYLRFSPCIINHPFPRG